MSGRDGELPWVCKIHNFLVGMTILHVLYFTCYLPLSMRVVNSFPIVGCETKEMIARFLMILPLFCVLFFTYVFRWLAVRRYPEHFLGVI